VTTIKNGRDYPVHGKRKTSEPDSLGQSLEVPPPLVDNFDHFDDTLRAGMERKFEWELEK
jgi:hypothetical protein